MPNGTAETIRHRPTSALVLATGHVVRLARSGNDPREPSATRNFVGMRLARAERIAKAAQTFWYTAPTHVASHGERSSSPRMVAFALSVRPIRTNG